MGCFYNMVLFIIYSV